MKMHTELKRILSLYTVGFLASLLLTMTSFLIVTEEWLTGASLTMAALLALASVQLVVQLVCFLHLGADKDPFSRTGTFLFAVGTLLIIIVGSLWIMNNLDYRMHMSPESMEDYMLEQNKKGF